MSEVNRANAREGEIVTPTLLREYNCLTTEVVGGLQDAKEGRSASQVG